MSWLDNGVIRVGIDRSLGGAITWLSQSTAVTPRPANVINSHDFGRQIQMSFYSGPVPFGVEQKKPQPHWRHLGWNPIQSGDDYGNRSRVLEHRNDEKEIYIRCLSRKPTEREAAALNEVVNNEQDKKQALEDIFWATLNSREFVFNH